MLICFKWFNTAFPEAVLNVALYILFNLVASSDTSFLGSSIFLHHLTLFAQYAPDIFPLSIFFLCRALKDFLRAIARAKFVFCPRGIGSSSFRAYQSLMAGSIPIITGMNDYPFKNQVDWDDFCFRGGEGAKWTELGEQNAGEVSRLTSKATQLSEDKYEQMRSNGIKFWDEYCRHDRLYEKLKDMV